jgi:hypothetical protein
MAGITGNIRGQRFQSSSNGYKTWGSILSAGGTGGSAQRIYNWYQNKNLLPRFYQDVYRLDYGALRSRSQYYLAVNF